MVAKKPLSVRIDAKVRDRLDELGNNATEVTERLLRQGLAWRERFGDTLPEEEGEPTGLTQEVAELRETIAELRDRLERLEKQLPVAQTTAV